MKPVLDNKSIWNEAAVSGMLFGAVSIACLMGKEAAAMSGNTFLISLAGIVLWATEFFGCILLMKKRMMLLKDKYYEVKIEESYKFGRRAALLSGLLVASANALIILKMPAETMDTMVGTLTTQLQLSASEMDSVNGVVDKLPVWTFIFQWIYCFLYGTVLSAIMARYVFIKRLFDGPSQEDQGPDEQ